MGDGVRNHSLTHESCQRYGTPSPCFGSTFEPLHENGGGGHSQGPNVAASEDESVETKSFLEASKHQPWVDAINSEMDALYRNNTWELVDHPKGRKAIGPKWVSKIKCKSDGKIKRYKVRILPKNKTVYMSLPPGYFPTKETRDYKLNKSLYGLKQAPRQLNAELTAALIENNFAQSKSDYSLFTKSCGDVFIALLVLLASKPSHIPIQPNVSLSNEPKDDDPLLDNVIEYQKLIGKLIYLTITSPGIAYIVSCLGQFMHSPLKSHLKTALKVIKYLKGSPGKGIDVIKRSASGIDLKAYTYADWARCTDTR
ncbi:ribonuclease H-like domain-containing protein, partial [Tanacetum coccineum]